MEQISLSEVVTRSRYAMHSGALHRDVGQHPLRCSVESSLQNARRRSSIVLAERLLRSAALRCTVGRIHCSLDCASQSYRIARIERALRYAGRRCSAALVERSMWYIPRSQWRHLVLLVECSLQDTPRPCVTRLVKSLTHYYPGRYGIVNAPEFNFYHRILRGKRYGTQAFFNWAVRTGILLLLIRCAYGVNYLEVRII